MRKPRASTKKSRQGGASTSADAVLGTNTSVPDGVGIEGPSLGGGDSDEQQQGIRRPDGTVFRDGTFFRFYDESCEDWWLAELMDRTNMQWANAMIEEGHVLRLDLADPKVSEVTFFCPRRYSHFYFTSRLLHLSFNKLTLPYSPLARCAAAVH